MPLRPYQSYEDPAVSPVLLVKPDSGRAARPRGPVAQQRLDIAFDYLFGLKSDPLHVGALDKDYWFGVLDAMGTPAILEAIAGGRIPSEIAISNRIPLLFFRQWMGERIDKDSLAEAMSVHAEVLVLKSQITLLADAASPQDAAMKRDLSGQLRWQAERADSKAWGPPGKSEAAPPALQLNVSWHAPGSAGPVTHGVTIEAQATKATNPFELPMLAEAQMPEFETPPTHAQFILSQLPDFSTTFGQPPRRRREATDGLRDRNNDYE